MFDIGIDSMKKRNLNALSLLDDNENCILTRGDEMNLQNHHSVPSPRNQTISR